MLGFIKARIYREKVFKRMETQLTSALGEDHGQEAFSAFATIILNSDIPKDLLEQLRKRKFTVEDAAVAYFDASISAMKKVLPKPASQDVTDMMARMETGLDKMFLDCPGMVVPRNGSAGPMMADFTKEL